MRKQVIFLIYSPPLEINLSVEADSLNPSTKPISMLDNRLLTGISGECGVNFLGYRTMSGTFAYQT